MQDNIPDEDLEFINNVIDGAKVLYGRFGVVDACAFIEPDPLILEGEHVVVVPIPHYTSDQDEQRRLALANVRHCSYSLNSPRCAIIAESWYLRIPEDQSEEIEKFMAEGKRIQEHPDAIEIVTIVVESDYGSTLIKMKIDRKHPEMTMLDAIGDAVFTPYADIVVMKNIASFFHVTSADKNNPDVIEWAKQMDIVFGDPKDMVSHDVETDGAKEIITSTIN